MPAGNVDSVPVPPEHIPPEHVSREHAPPEHAPPEPVAPEPLAPPARQPRRAGGKWGDLLVRILSALVLVPLALGGIWAGALPWVALVVLIAGGLGVEWVALCHETWRSVAGLGVILSLVSTAVAGSVSPLAALLLAALAITLALILRGPRLGGGILYIALATIALLWLRADPAAGRGNLLFLMLTVWASDIGAYLAGRLIGGAKLAPRISPGKTWSGGLGGLLGAIVIGLAASRLGGGAPLHAGLVAALLGVIAQAGDLFESFLKRRFGVKDSSHLIPGHGGLLDRLDGVLAAAPVAAMLALIIGRGGSLWM